MKLKEAIAILRDYETPAAIVVLCELRKLKAEKRAMWRALSKRCEFLCHTGNCDRDGIGKCTQRNCPLLKGKVKR